MTLKDFIKNTIYDINIALEETYKETGKYYQIGESHAKDKSIAFDIAVTQSAEGSIGGQGGIQVWGFGLGGKKESKEGEQNVSRIQFNVFLSNTNPMTDIDRYTKEGEDRFSQARSTVNKSLTS